MNRIFALSALLTATAAPALAAPAFTTRTIWAYDHNGDEPPFASTSEIVAYDAASQLIFATGGDGVTALDRNGDRVRGYSQSLTPTSVDVANGIVAVAGLFDNSFGAVQFFDRDTAALLRTVRTTPDASGADDLPDTVKFTPDGLRAIVANEGEAGEGSIGVIDVATGAIQRAGFAAFDNAASRAALLAQGANLTEAETLDQQLQPEFVAVSADGRTAYVTVQEQNIIATVDISGASPVVTGLRGLGLIDRSVVGFDPSDRDGGPNVRTFAATSSTREPDQIETFTQRGQRYLITADESDTGVALSDLLPVTAANLDPTVFPDPATTLAAANLGRGEQRGIDSDGDGDVDRIVRSGGRSITIYDTDGEIVWTSGDTIERQLIAAGLLNDGRSDNSGPEPEGVVVGRVGGRLLAFVSIERGGSVMVFDITDPANGQFVSIITSDFADNQFDEPEGLAFISSAESWDGFAYLAISSEDSGFTFLQRISVPAPATLALFGLGVAGLTLARRRR